MYEQLCVGCLQEVLLDIIIAAMYVNVLLHNIFITENDNNRNILFNIMRR